MATEDFTTYTEVEGANAVITIDANTIDCDDIRNDEISHVSKDFTADYFAGDFEFLVNIFADASGHIGIYSYHGVWALANAVADLDALGVANANYLAVGWLREGAADKYIRLQESDGGDGGTIYSDASAAITEGIWYYLRIKRDEAVGDFGTLTCDIYTSVADRTNEENAFDNLTIPGGLHTAKRDWRYLYGMLSFTHSVNSIGSWFTVEDLEIVSGGGEPPGGSIVPILLDPTRRRRV